MQNKQSTGLTALVAFPLMLSAWTAQSADFYLSPTGSDATGDGSTASPWQTLHKARDHIRTLPRPLTENVTVHLADGVYELSSTLQLTSADSGNNSYSVKYTAQNAGQAIISGGSVVSGWTDSNNDGIWQAAVDNAADSRQLFVDGRRAVRARSVNGSGWSENSSGYATSTGAENWSNVQDIELVFEFRWKQNRGGVSAISSGQATLDSDFFFASGLEPFGRPSQTNRPSWVENNLALLDAEDEWYLDTHNDLLYYKPRAGESMTGSNAVSVVLPRLETLISGDGVQYVRFEGLTFSNATWLLPNGPIGYVSVQAGVNMRDINYVTIEDAFEGIEATPGNVEFDNSKHIVFANNTFKNLGGAGIEMGPGSQHSTIFNNTFEDISASAIVVGSAQEHHPIGEFTKDILVDNNLVKNVAAEYRDNPAIVSLWAEGTVVINNTIESVPYSGVSVGWGWGRYDVDDFGFTTDNTGKGYNKGTVLKDTLVLNNMINGLMLVLHDGGGIYNLSANPNSRVTGNVVTAANDLNGAVYLDDGSRGFQVNNNVSYNNRGSRVNEHIKGGQFHIVQDNDWSGASSTFQSSSQSIVDAAGRKSAPVERTVAAIRAALPAPLPLPAGSIPPTDGLVIGKTATASHNSANADAANDGDVTTAWQPGSGLTSAWWQIDLGSNFNVGHVGMAFGRVIDGAPQYIRNNIEFEILTSTDGSNFSKQTFSTVSGAAATIPSTQRYTTVQAINDTLITGNPEARYVRINVTNSNGQDFGILRAKVKAAAVPDPLPGTNLALTGTASQSTTAHGGVASRANDGNTDGSFPNNSVSHTDLQSQPYWDIDLGSVNQINTVRLWNRTDCCGDRLADFSVFVSDSPFSGTTIADSRAQSGVFEFYHPQIADSFEDALINRTGRYVRVQLGSTSQVLALAEVEVYGNSLSSSTNLALAGTATQSSTVFGATAARAIDGDTNGVYTSNSVTHTNAGTQSYWDLDLGGLKQIDQIKVWNRTDPCCTARLSDFHVFVSDVPFSGTTVAASQAQSGVTDHAQAGAAANTTTVAVSRTGRYVRVQLEANNEALSLAEVQVFGSDLTVSNLALNGSASQSSTIANAPASRAIDGNTDGVFNNNSVTHTGLGSQNYWQLDLGSVKQINNIKIWNRTDCCAQRLTNFSVFVSDNAFTGTSVTDSQNQAGVFEHQHSGTASTTTEVSVSRTGRYIRIQLANTNATSGENVLSLAEVEVNGY